jgi:hypothetical protein
MALNETAGTRASASGLTASTVQPWIGNHGRKNSSRRLAKDASPLRVNVNVSNVDPLRGAGASAAAGGAVGVEQYNGLPLSSDTQMSVIAGNVDASPNK